MQTIIDNHKLIKIKIELEYEIVGDDIYQEENIQHAAEGIFRANRRDIIDEAVDNMAIRITAKEIKTKADLPEGYTDKCYPWINVTFGIKEPGEKIGEILK